MFAIVDAVVQLLHILRMLPPDVVLQLVAVLPTEYTTAGVAFFGLFSEHPDFFGLQVGQAGTHHHALALLLVPLQVRIAVERLLAVGTREYRFRRPSLVVHLVQMSRKIPFLRKCFVALSAPQGVDWRLDLLNLSWAVIPIKF